MTCYDKQHPLATEDHPTRRVEIPRLGSAGHGRLNIELTPQQPHRRLRGGQGQPQCARLMPAMHRHIERFGVGLIVNRNR